MKWFKHYSNVSESNALTYIKAEYGFQGMGRYWALLEEMSKKFNGEGDNTFVFHAAHLRALMGYHRTQDLIKFLSSLDQVGIMSHRTKNQAIIIETDILSKLQGKDFKYSRSKRDKNDPKNKIKNKIKNNIDQSFFLNDALIDDAYKHYPKKAGKARGYKKLKSIIKNQKAYDDFKSAVINYAEHCKKHDMDLRFIKQFSTFCNEDWKDYVNAKDIQNTIKTEEEIEAELNAILEG